MRSRFLVLLALFPTLAAADALTDLRASLARLPATTAVRGTFEVSTTSRSDEDKKAEPGKAAVRFEVSDAGLHILYPRATLNQAVQEARARAADPEKSTPVQAGFREIRALHVADLLDSATSLSTLLETAQLVDAKAATYRGRPARNVVVKLVTRMSKSEAKHLKKFESTLSIWLAEDGTPMAAERATRLKASFLLMSIESDQKQSWQFTRTGDRLVATRFEETEKTDGMGQHTVQQTTETLTLE